MVRLLTSGMTVRQFGSWLSRYVGRPVVDQTGLAGDFDIELSFSPEATLSPVAGVGDDPSIATAVQEQLGLKLDARKAPVDVLVVDEARRTPVEN